MISSVRRLVRRSLRPTASRDEGLSLMELIVAMAMASILFIAIGTLFVSSLRQNRTVSAKTTTTADARIAMEAATRELRVAVIPKGQTNAFVSATATAISFYTSTGTSTATTDPNPSLITLSYTSAHAHCLWREVTPATMTGTTPSWPTASKKSACVARGDFSGNLFTFYPLANDDTISTTAYTSGQLAADLGNIASVGLSFSIVDPTNPTVVATTVQDQVTLTNIATLLAAS